MQGCSEDDQHLLMTPGHHHTAVTNGCVADLACRLYGNVLFNAKGQAAKAAQRQSAYRPNHAVSQDAVHESGACSTLCM